MLQKITDLLLIKKGEQQQVAYLVMLFFLIGAGMALGKGASETLFFKRYGIEYLPVMYIISSLSLFLVSLLYASYVDLLPSERFYRILFVTIAVLLLGNWYATQSSVSELVYPAFFLLYEVASELLLVHCAVYASQNLVQTQSKRLTPIILSGFQVGIIAGGLLLATASPLLGVANMMLLWIAILSVSYISISIWHKRHGVSPYFRAARKGKSHIGQSLTQLSQGLKLLKTSRLLRMSSLSLFFLVISVYVLAYAVNTIYTKSFDTEESLSAFFGLLTATTGILALIIQLFFTNRLIRDHGLKKINLTFPLTSILSYSALLVAYTLPAAIIGSLNKETLMPAFAKPVRNIFNAALPSKIQGRAQAIAVILVIPLGLSCAGLFLVIAQRFANIEYFLLIGLLCSVALLVFNMGMNRAYAQEILANLKKCLYIPDRHADHFLEGNQDELIKDIEQGLMSNEDDISIIYARVLSKSEPEKAARLIPQRMSKAGTALKDQMVKILQPIQTEQVKDSLKKELGTGDTHLDATLLKALFQSRDPEEKHRVATLLDDTNPRIKAAGIYGALHYPIPELIEKAVDEWIELLENAHVDNYMPAVELIVPEFRELYHTPPLLHRVQDKLIDMLEQDVLRFTRIALNILSTWPAGSFDQVRETLVRLSVDENWIIRKACIKASHLLSEQQRNKLIINALEDKHPNVRNAAVQVVATDQVDDISYIQHLLINKHTGSPRAQQTMLEYLMDAGCDSHTMHAISLSLANDARDLKQACEMLMQPGIIETPAATLLSHALEERVLELTDLSLFAIQSSSHDEDIAVIRAGLSSNDKRQYSNACELLTMINNQSLAELILPLFDDTISAHRDTGTNRPFSNLESMVNWISERSDPWLSECCGYFRATYSEQNHV